MGGLFPFFLLFVFWFSFSDRGRESDPGVWGEYGLAVFPLLNRPVFV